MNKNQNRKVKSPTYSKQRPALNLQSIISSESTIAESQPVKVATNTKLTKEEAPGKYESTEAVKARIERFVEISKYFSSPPYQTASYMCENCLVSFPSSYRIEYKRTGVTTGHIKFCNIILEPVYVKLFKVIPDLAQVKFINLSLSRCKRIPPGLSLNMGFIYDDVDEKSPTDAKIIFVVSRKTTTPCYQICEVDLIVEVQKPRLVPYK